MQVIDTENENHKYGLRIPGMQIDPGHGSRHRHDCLKQLALFDLPQHAASEAPPDVSIMPQPDPDSMVAG